MLRIKVKIPNEITNWLTLMLTSMGFYYIKVTTVLAQDATKISSIKRCLHHCFGYTQKNSVSKHAGNSQNTCQQEIINNYPQFLKLKFNLMIKKVLTTAIIVIAVVTVCFAQDITGKWSGKVMDQFEVTYDFKVDGEKLTGNTSGPDGTPIPIQNGVIKDDDLSFTIKMMGNNMKVTGKVKDDIVTLTMPGIQGDDPIVVVLKKVK
jgi:hypothetical protein